jgi:predicted dehydrogenase
LTAGGRARLRIALVGTGWIMDFHAQAVLEHPGAELAAAANWRRPSLDRLAERHRIARTTTDWRALAADPGVDAAIVATPNALHAPQAIALLEAASTCWWRSRWPPAWPTPTPWWRPPARAGPS